MISRTSVWRHFDLWLLAAVLILTAYGILMIHSAITGAAEFVGFDIRQAQLGLVGLVLLFIIASIDYRFLTASHWYIYGFFMLLLIYVAVAGTLGNAAQRWIQITDTFRLQPTEFGRIFFAVTFAQFLAQRRDHINRFSNTLLSLAYVGVPVIFIFLQPDLGMSILFMVLWFIMIWMAGLPISHFVAVGVIGVVATAIIFPFLADYQLDRLTAFINPDASSPEIQDQTFNVTQALVSIATGGWLGKGYLNGTQSQLGFLRVQHTDFIFSMLTEEMGFVFGSLFVTFMLGFILYRILHTAAITPDPAGRLICVGIAGMLFFQIVVSIGMNVRLLPVTGLTLPFVSFGGSSLISLLMAIGVVQSVRMRHRKQEFG